MAVELHVLDAARDLRPGPVRKLELVEHVSGDAPVIVRVEQAAERAWRIPGRGQRLLTGLQPERGRQRGEAQVEREQLHLGAAFLLLAGEGLAYAVAEDVGRVGQTKLIMLVVGRAEPEAHRVDAAGHAGGIRPCW